ncbi:ectonucleoside triphosphate diphosphohydrolase 2 [Kryptolebias marmoratus]|uniref:Ectonucleoside triphosphate diphosphohydrolase 2b n=1 Tax=Kryptolebias marmoratus TaxID=37003 RepID=A0A3Q3AV24_KRYMA|nr:ectonucleoside triphosphate diphosphohydrolase 2 [Kryptolebias marmoratus]
MAQRCSSPVLLLSLLLFGLVAILLLTVPTEDVQEAPGFRYGIVLDAGSSHTSFYIYKWPADKQNGTGVVTQHRECHIDGGGISSYAGQAGAAGQSLEACLDQAVNYIPEDRHHSTPVYLGATAGMRLLNISNSKQASQILEEVGLKIQSYPFNYRGAAILTGQQEGAYGWVTVNYLLENFIKYGFVGRWFSPGRPTVGALDFGGASTQITFATQELVEDKNSGMKLRLYGRDYSLYTHSFLCYGKDQFLKRLLANIVKTQGSSQTVTHPCYPTDFNRTIKMEDIFGSPCTGNEKPGSYDPRDALTVRGGGHYEHCVGNVSALFSFDGCGFSRCSFDSVFQPNVTGSFMAFSAFFYIHSFLQQVTGILMNTPQKLEEAAKSVCGMTFQQILLRAPKEKARLHEYCAASVFVKTLLLRGYGFDDATFPHVSFQKKAGDTSVGWALGYMLILSNFLPAESAGVRKALSEGAWGTLIFLFVVFLVVVLAFLFFRTGDRKKGRDENAI